MKKIITANVPGFSQFSGPLLMSPVAARALHARLLTIADFSPPPPSRDPGVFSTPPIEQYAKTDGLAIVNMVGVLSKYPSPDPALDDWLGLCPTTKVQSAINAALADPSIAGIVLRIDCPGGAANGTVELADTVNAARKKKPVFAAVSGSCLSGGYYIASQCDRITANSAAEVGCIGVYSVLTDISGLLEQAGVKQALVTTGRYKGLGADGEVSADLIEDTQRSVNDMQLLFVNAVASGRKMTAQSVSALADGRGWIAQQALDKGFIDEVMPLDDAVAGFMQGVLRGSKPLTPDGDQPRPTMAPRSRPLVRRIPTRAVQRPSSRTVPLDPESLARAEWRGMDKDQRDRWIDMHTFLRQRTKAIAASRAAR